MIEILELEEIQCESCAGEALDLVTVNGQMICLACINDKKRAYCGE